MADNNLSAVEFGRKIGKSHNYVSEVKKCKTSNITPPMVRRISEAFPMYNPEWVRTGDPPIYAAEVTIHGSGNIGNGNNNNVTTINERLLAAVEQMCETARIHAEAAKTNAETIAQLLKLNKQ